ncbi:MAG: hypothetical protein R3Y13_02365 [bacterium]
MKSRVVENAKDRYLLLVFITFLLVVFSLILTTSHAYLSDEDPDAETAYINLSTCIDLSFSDASYSIYMDNAYPVSNNVGINYDPYEFSIVNQCENSLLYSVYLVINGESNIEADYVNVYYGNESAGDKFEILTLSDYKESTFSSDYEFQYTKITGSEVESVYLLGTYQVSDFLVHELSMKLWLNSNLTSNSNNLFSANIVVANTDS